MLFHVILIFNIFYLLFKGKNVCHHRLRKKEEEKSIKQIPLFEYSKQLQVWKTIVGQERLDGRVERWGSNPRIHKHR